MTFCSLVNKNSFFPPMDCIRVSNSCKLARQLPIKAWQEKQFTLSQTLLAICANVMKPLLPIFSATDPLLCFPILQCLKVCLLDWLVVVFLCRYLYVLLCILCSNPLLIPVTRELILSVLSCYCLPLQQHVLYCSRCVCVIQPKASAICFEYHTSSLGTIQGILVLCAFIQQLCHAINIKAILFLPSMVNAGIIETRIGGESNEPWACWRNLWATIPCADWSSSLLSSDPHSDSLTNTVVVSPNLNTFVRISRDACLPLFVVPCLDVFTCFRNDRKVEILFPLLCPWQQYRFLCLDSTTLSLAWWNASICTSHGRRLFSGFIAWIGN